MVNISWHKDLLVRNFGYFMWPTSHLYPAALLLLLVAAALLLLLPAPHDLLTFVRTYVLKLLKLLEFQKFENS